MRQPDTQGIASLPGASSPLLAQYWFTLVQHIAESRVNSLADEVAQGFTLSDL